MCEIIQFPINYTQYKFLYFKGKRKEPVFEIWYKDFMSNEGKIIIKKNIAFGSVHQIVF